VPKSLKAQNAAAAKLLMSWGSTASPVLKMQATWDYFIHVCNGPTSFVTLLWEYTACFSNFLFAFDVLFFF